MVDVTGKREVLVMVKVSSSVIVPDIEAVSVIVNVLVCMNSTVSVVNGPVGTVDVEATGGPTRQRAHGAISHSIVFSSLKPIPTLTSP